MDYTLCNNSECKTKDDCLRYKNYLIYSAEENKEKEHKYVKYFTPYNENMCKYKLIRIGSENN